jgi:predicted lipoprotein
MKVIVGLLLGATLATCTLGNERFDTTTLADFLNSQKELDRSLEAFCTSNKETASAAQVKLSWSANAVNWYRVQALQLPATEFMQTEFNYVFWPDPKDRLKKQVLSATEISPASHDWADLPASTKSLSAIEFLIGTDNPQHFCDWYAAIMKVQLKQTAELTSLQAFYDFSDIEQITALHGTALTLHSQLKEVLSRPGNPRWVFAPGWRTETSPSIQGAFLEQLNMLMMPYRLKHKDIETWQTLLAELPDLSLNSTREQVEAVNNFAVALAQFVEADLAPSLDIYLGFNNFDGD